nr:hypothetical protein [Syntrophus aciditrophicus]
MFLLEFADNLNLDRINLLIPNTFQQNLSVLSDQLFISIDVKYPVTTCIFERLIPCLAEIIFPGMMEDFISVFIRQ